MRLAASIDAAFGVAFDDDFGDLLPAAFCGDLVAALGEGAVEPSPVTRLDTSELIAGGLDRALARRLPAPLPRPAAAVGVTARVFCF
jgi:hypothetical protein